jgi:hypothetical protein
MNTLTYIIYLLITYIITVHVGLAFYRNGRIYILGLMHGDVRITDSINRLLLTGYYLLNLGYAALSLRDWKTINNWTELVTSITFMTGKIMLLLAVIHFFNMGAIIFISRRHPPVAGNKIHHAHNP